MIILEREDDVWLVECDVIRSSDGARCDAREAVTASKIVSLRDGAGGTKTVRLTKRDVAAALQREARFFFSRSGELVFVRCAEHHAEHVAAQELAKQQREEEAYYRNIAARSKTARDAVYCERAGDAWRETFGDAGGGAR